MTQNIRQCIIAAEVALESSKRSLADHDYASYPDGWHERFSGAPAQDQGALLEEIFSAQPPEWQVEESRLGAAVTAAEAELAAAREALIGSNEPRQWDLAESGYQYETVTARTAEEALDIAVGNVARANYADCEGTLYIDVSAYCEETGEESWDTVTLEPEEPECAEGEEHDWRSPYSVLGGLKENPGVWGHGGGAIIKEVCRLCGWYRTTDTWAQRPDTGEQGLTEVSYAEPDEDSLAYVERKFLDLAEEILEGVGAVESYQRDGDKITVTLAPDDDAEGRLDGPIYLESADTLRTALGGRYSISSPRGSGGVVVTKT
jgi:hypothetical protein